MAEDFRIEYLGLDMDQLEDEANRITDPDYQPAHRRMSHISPEERKNRLLFLGWMMAVQQRSRKVA